MKNETNIDVLNEYTERRIRAYLASMGPRNELSEGAERGRSLIEQIALSAQGDAHPEPVAIQLSTAQDELQAAAGLCRAGALALRAAAKPGIPAALPEVQKPVAGIVESALKGLWRALDALENVKEDDGDVGTPIFNVYGLLLVIQSALIADKPVDGRNVVMDPIADSLEVVVDTMRERQSDQDGSERAVAGGSWWREGELMSNITRFGPPNGAQPPEKPPQKPEPSEPRRALLLDAHRTYSNGQSQDFDTRDVIRGLYGVCVTLDEDPPEENAPWLASAARVLASILHHHAEDEPDQV